MLNIGLSIPGNWSFEIRRISAGEIRMKSGGFQVKSTQNPPDFMNVSFCVMIKYRSFFRKTKHAEIPLPNSPLSIRFADWFSSQYLVRFASLYCHPLNPFDTIGVSATP